MSPNTSFLSGSHPRCVPLFLWTGLYVRHAACFSPLRFPGRFQTIAAHLISTRQRQKKWNNKVWRVFAVQTPFYCGQRGFPCKTYRIAVKTMLVWNCGLWTRTCGSHCTWRPSDLNKRTGAHNRKCSSCTCRSQTLRLFIYGRILPPCGHFMLSFNPAISNRSSSFEKKNSGSNTGGHKDTLNYLDPKRWYKLFSCAFGSVCSCLRVFDLSNAKKMQRKKETINNQ